MKFKSAFPYIVAFLLVPLCIAVGVFAFHDKAYLPVSICIALLACLPFFIAFEKRNGNVQLAVILAVMTALSVLGRFAFAAIPHFKPVSAIVIITGMYLGAQSGFLCGALSAVLSNILFGQGPWTPFQMLAWGLIGLFAALLGGLLRKNKIVLAVFGALAGVFYSLIMDIWTVLWWEEFSLSRYLAAIASSGVVMLIYAASNVIFLLLLAKPTGEKLGRVMKKYGLDGRTQNNHGKEKI